jgi:hypothetical protein
LITFHDIKEVCQTCLSASKTANISEQDQRNLL